MEEVTINVKRLSNNSTLPTRGSVDAAGYDLYTSIDRAITILPHAAIKIPTDLAFELPQGTFAAIFARSGLAANEGLRPANCVGVCDSDYRGNYIVVLHNDTDEERLVTPGERIAQMVLLPYIPMQFKEVNELTETERGEGGFGSTGQ